MGDQSFIERLVGARHIAGMSQADLAKAAGVSKRTIESYEQGATVPRTGVSTLAAALGVDAHWLVFGTLHDVGQLTELAADLRFQTEALHDALRFANTQWEAFHSRVLSLEQRLVALEVLNERIEKTMAELLRRQRVGTPGEPEELRAPAPPLDVEEPEPGS